MTVKTRNIADSAVTPAKVAAGGLTGVKVATVADANTVGGIPVVYRVTSTVGTVAVVVAEKIRVIDVTVVAKATQAAGTVTVKNGATAITDDIICAVDTTVTRAGTIDDAQHEIAAAGTMNVVVAGAASNADVYITAIRVA